MRKISLAIATAALLGAGSAQSAIDIYAVGLYGSNECARSAGGLGVCDIFGVGDPDGWGAATVMIDNLTNTVTWSAVAFNITLPLSAAHIHPGAAGVNGPAAIDFGGALAGSVVDADAASINPGNAMDWYLNLHNVDYRPGAIRGQLMYVKTVNPPVPEPETYAMFAAGLAGIALMIRRRRGNR
jgi:hypothetical protein